MIIKKIITGTFAALTVSAPLVLIASGGGGPPAASHNVLGPNSPSTRVASTNWAGYVVHGARSTRVSASWTQPSVRPTARLHLAGFWDGLDGVTSDTVEQCGTSGASENGKTSYWAWYEMLPAYAVVFSNAPVHPGDRIRATTAYHRGWYTMTVADHTRGWTRTVHVKAPGLARSSAEVVAEAPLVNGGKVPLAHFSPVTFSGIRVDGSPMKGPTPVTMVLPSGRTATSVSPFTGSGFTATWKR